MKKIWILLVAAALTVGCNDNSVEEEPGGDSPNQLTLSTETLIFLVDGTSVDGSNSVTITSDGDWRIAGYESWCTPSATSGKSGDKVTFAVAENPANDARSAIYTFIRGNQAAKLTVSQLQNSVFDPAMGDSYTVSSFQQTMTLVVRSSFDFTPEIDVPWIVNADVEQTRGVESRFLRFLVDANEEYSGRTGKIIVTDMNGVAHELIINQNQRHAVIPSKKLYDVDATGGTITVSLQSNIDYTISLSGYSWITEQTTRALAPSEKTFRIAASTNTRQGQIVFKYSPTDGSPAVADTVLIAQRVGQTIQVDVPDDNFRYFLRKNDYVLSKPGEQTCEMTAKGIALTSMTCNSLNIASLKGVEAFTALTSLMCNTNDLTELDVSANTALNTLSCSSNMLTKLDLTNCGALRSLTVPYNPLEELLLHPDAPINTMSLIYLRDAASTVFSSKLKVVAPKMKSFNCYNNKLTELDITGCPSITSLSCFGNQLTKLDVSACVNLSTLNCHTNQLEALDVSANTALTSITCNTNALKTLDVSTNLKLTTLNCTLNPDLLTLYMAQNQSIYLLTKDEHTEIVRK